MEHIQTTLGWLKNAQTYYEPGSDSYRILQTKIDRIEVKLDAIVRMISTMRLELDFGDLKKDE